MSVLDLSTSVDLRTCGRGPSDTQKNRPATLFAAGRLSGTALDVCTQSGGIFDGTVSKVPIERLFRWLEHLPSSSRGGRSILEALFRARLSDLLQDLSELLLSEDEVEGCRLLR